MEKEILQLSKEIIDELLNSKDSSYTFESLGISDGKDIIQEYVNNSETGLAYEHLEYIISESNISLSISQLNRMSTIAQKFK